MMALSKKMLEQEPGDIELLLPWYAAGTLNARDMRRVEEALAQDADLALQYAEIQKEYAETIALNESLGAPSMRAMQKLFAAIEAEPEQAPKALPGAGARIMAFFESLSPRTLVWTVSLGALLVVAQAGIIGAVLMRSQTATYQTASVAEDKAVQEKSVAPAPVSRPMAAAPPPPSAAAPALAERAPDSSVARQRMAEAPAPAAPLIRGLGPQVAGSTAPVYALVRFAPDARMADITALLDSYQASIVGGAQGGLFKLQLGNQPLSRADADGLIGRLSREKIVSLAVAAQ
ncbi:conserved hypothetical protein, putative Translation initiation factor IF-2 [Bradyrhizobium sp. ORS 285]|uniref:hypothetical protein n=1 Tax=Bradyrhizobium sp. ORS 285 TaxID=115808 RepID=UPI000240A611|nr:hypothetical protein [Bradyrhizobium sp. ORS 285]CCD87626.1 conserved hypothetical protein [Bradyrhizobium sp. ORS 285]SMX59513.1 conserved hypothetical protein, putative Translation initiation factor IF-2 [Bradyrhizobium sp. ORS 285]